MLNTFALSILIPLGWSILAAFKHKSEFYQIHRLTRRTLFRKLLKLHLLNHMGEYFFNSLFVTLTALVILLVISIPAAYVFIKFNFVVKALNTIFLP